MNCRMIRYASLKRKMVFGLKPKREVVIPFNAVVRQTGYYQLGFLRVAESDLNAVK